MGAVWARVCCSHEWASSTSVICRPHRDVVAWLHDAQVFSDEVRQRHAPTTSDRRSAEKAAQEHAAPSASWRFAASGRHAGLVGSSVSFTPRAGATGTGSGGARVGELGGRL